MAPIFKSTNVVIGQIEEFLTIIDESSLVFQNGIRNYLRSNREEFNRNLEMVDKKEGQADAIRRSVEDSLYRHSLLPEFRGDVLHLLERLDDLADIAKENLMQFNVESPDIPEAIHDDFLELTGICVKSVESVVLVTRTFFRDPRAVKDMLHRVYFYEKEADRIANLLKKNVFSTPEEELHLSRKNHIRHFISKTEDISDVAEDIADTLAILAIKRIS